MALPDPNNYDTWQAWASAVAQTLNDSGVDGSVRAQSAEASNPTVVPLLPAGFRPVWLTADEASLYLGNSYYDPPLAGELFQIDTSKIADAAVATANLANEAVTTTKIGLLAVGSAQIADAAIVTAKIGEAQIVEAKIADLAVNTGKIANAAITSAKIANLAVGNAQIAMEISSATWDPATGNGWLIDRNGNIQGKSLTLYSATGSTMSSVQIFSRFDSVEGGLATANTTLVSQGAAITSNATAISNTNSNVANLTTTVTSQGAQIVANSTAISNIDGDVASLTSVVSTQGGQITSNATAISNTNSSLASLTSTVNTQGAAITSNATAISTTNTNVANLTTTVSAQGSAIVTNANAIATTNTNVASLTTTVSAQGVAITANATATATAQSGVNTVLAKVGLTLNVSGYITGWALNNNGQSGDAVFVVDNFKITSPSGLLTPFEVSGDKVYIKNAVIENLSIGTNKITEFAVNTGKIGTFAIRKTYFVETASSVSIPAGSGRQRIISVVAVKDIDNSDIEVRFFMRARPAVDYAGYFVVGANSGSGDADLDAIWLWAPSVVVGGLRSLRIPVAYFKRFAGYAAGSYTVYVDIVTFAGGISGSNIEAGSNLLVEEMKR